MNCQEAKGTLDLTKNLSKTYKQKKQNAKNQLEKAKKEGNLGLENQYQHEINEIEHEQKMNRKLRAKAKYKLNSNECK
jgi:hypothetical protein